MNYKKDYQLKKEIKSSIKKECLMCGNSTCIKSHSISKKKYLSKIEEESHVIGNHREKGLINLSKISINDASTFYNFCIDCDKIFYALDNHDFQETSNEQVFLLYYRLLSEQVHQIKEEIIFYEKNNISTNIKKVIESNKIALNKYSNKIDFLNTLLKSKNFDAFECKVIELNFEIKFVYSNIINVPYDMNFGQIKQGNEIAISIFNDNNATKIILVWEKENDKYLSNYVKQLLSLDLIALQYYLTNIIIAFPANFFANPTAYSNWNKKSLFEEEVCYTAENLLKYPQILYNFFLKQQKFNLFKMSERND